MRAALERVWYAGAWWSILLLPAAWLYGLAVSLRCLAYRLGWLRSRVLPVPVIVVGNLTVGGTGKTPLVAWIAERLRARGRRPGIVSRGYGGTAREWPQRVTAESDPRSVGDEPVLLAATTGCPVAAAPDRVAAARLLIASGADVIVADDGLQHYRLARDFEIAVRDGDRGYGNGRLLPAGPLREPLRRLRRVDVELVNGEDGDFHLQALAAVALDGTQGEKPLSAFAGTSVHAVAGIGHPQRFFDSLRAFGIRVVAHAFADHYRYRAADLDFGDGLPVLMTGKDAVKCRAFAGAGCWYVPVRAVPGRAAEARLEALFDRLERMTA